MDQRQSRGRGFQRQARNTSGQSPRGGWPGAKLAALVAALMIFALLPWASYGQGAVQETARAKSTADVHVLKSDDTSITLELRVPEWKLRKVDVEGVALDEIAVAGYSYLDTPDQPRLPVKIVTLGIPAGAKPTLEVRAVDGQHVEGGVQLVATAAPASVLDEADLWPGGLLDTGKSLSPSPRLAAITKTRRTLSKGAGLYPAQPAQITQIGQYRSQQFVQLRLAPFQYDVARRELQAVERLEVVVHLDGGASAVAAGVDEGPFEPALQNLLLNYEDARLWRVPSGATAKSAPSAYSGRRIRIEVNQDGLYQLDTTTLTASWLLAAPLSTYQLFSDYSLTLASEIPLEVVDQNSNNALDSGDAIRFYGRAADASQQRYTGTRVYWLVAGLASGKRMTTRSGVPGAGAKAPDFPATVHTEQDNRYYWNLPTGGDTHWYWSYIVQTSATTAMDRTYTVTLPNISPNAHTATLRVKLAGISSSPTVNPDHHTQAYLGNSATYQAIDSAWDGSIAALLSGGGIPSSSLVSGGNTVKLRVPALPTGLTSDAFFLDWLEVDYRQAFIAVSNALAFNTPGGYSQYQIMGFTGSAVGVYDIGDPNNPVRLTGTQTDGGGTLTFGDAAPSPQRYLALLLQSPSLLTPSLVAEVDSGPDLRASSNAARYIVIAPAAFLAPAARLVNYRSGALSSRLIQVEDIYNQFGNGSLDPVAIHSFLAYALANWSVAPQYVVLLGDGTYDYRNILNSTRKMYIPPYMAMVDPWLGETADDNFYAAVSGASAVPDLMTGRLPANSVDEANAMIDKIIASEQAATQTPSPLPASVLFVTDNYEPSTSAGNFPAIADNLAADTIPNTFSAQKIEFGVNYTSPAAVTTAITTAYNQGQRFVTYIGHSAMDQWAAEPLFTVANVAGLANSGQYPVNLAMTCLEGSFQDPGKDALGEMMVRASGKGAVATWSPTGLGVATGHDVLNRAFNNAIFTTGVRRIGPAILAGKAALYAFGDSLDLLNTYTLLGDPATDTGIQGIPPTATPTPTNTPTRTPVPPTATPTPTSTATGTATPTATATVMATATRTATMTPTATASATATPTSTSVLSHITGSVVLQGLASNAGAVVQVGAASAMTGPSGAFDLAVPPGSYVVTASAPHYLSSQASVTVSANQPNLSLGSVLQRAGDIDNNGVIDLFDLVVVAGNYGLTPPSNSAADINKDGSVDLFDLVIVGGNYGLQSYQPWTTVATGAGTSSAKRRPSLTTSLDKKVSALRADVWVDVPARVKAEDEFTVPVRIAGARAMAGADVMLQFDPAAVELLPPQGAAVPRAAVGDLFNAAGDFVAVNTADTASGQLRYAAIHLANTQGTADTGTLLYLRFRARADGSPAIFVARRQLVDAEGSSLTPR